MASKPSSAWGEFKQATVLFADIVDSTTLIAGLDSEQAMERLRPAVLAMGEAVERFGGTVVQTLGDGILAIFGAPRAHEGHALLACEAALAMQEAFSRGPDTLAIRVGLHSGEVVSDPPLTDVTKERRAHGMTIHLASRVPRVAEPGGICLTEFCYRLVRSYCDASPLGPHELKGIPEPVEMYCLLGLKPAVASQPFRGMNLTSFRGRDQEMRMMQGALRRIEDGDTRVLGIVGAPGTGKSRLCYEFGEWCRGRLIPVFEARAQLYGHATHLQPVLEILRSLFFRILPTDDAGAARSRIAERLAELESTLEDDLPLMYEILGVPANEPPAGRLNPKARHSRLLEIVRQMIRHGGATTSVILIEDLHWLDEASEDFIAMLVDAVSGTRTMLVLNYRPSYDAPWMQFPYYQQISLAELSPAETNALVEELVGPRPELSDICQRVAKRSGGNPFFAEELVRSLADDRVLSGDLGDYAPGMNTGESTLPATIQAVIGARIDHLGEVEKTLLQICAVIGKEIPVAVLEGVADTPLKEIEAGLNNLCHSGLIQMHSSADGRLSAFRHPLIQEVAYGTQLKARRGALHHSVARAMERHYTDRLNEFAGLLAYHYEAAGQPLNAAHYAARAAMWVGSTSPAQAIRHWQKVRLLLQDLPRSHDNDALRIMASAQISWLGWREGLTAEQAKPFIQEALGWAREIDDTMVPLLLFVEGRITVASGGPADTYVERVKEALSLLDPRKDVGRAATLYASLSQAYGWAGLLREALAANDAALERVSRIEKFDHQFLGYGVEHWAKSLRGRLLARLGRFAEAQPCFDDILAIEQSLIDPTVQFIAHMGCIDIAWCRDDAATAEQHAMSVAEIAEKHGSPYLRVFAYASAGAAKGIAKDIAGAVLEFTEGLKFVRKTRAAMEYEAEILASLSDCHFQAGEYELALATAKEAIEIARQRSARLPECRASITCGAALLARHGAARSNDAAAFFLRAEELIELSGARIYEAPLAQERGRLSAVAG